MKKTYTPSYQKATPNNRIETGPICDTLAEAKNWLQAERKAHGLGYARHPEGAPTYYTGGGFLAGAWEIIVENEAGHFIKIITN